jgi:hypothetical protein
MHRTHPSLNERKEKFDKSCVTRGRGFQLVRCNIIKKRVLGQKMRYRRTPSLKERKGKQV